MVAIERHLEESLRMKTPHRVGGTVQYHQRFVRFRKKGSDLHPRRPGLLDRVRPQDSKRISVVGSDDCGNVSRESHTTIIATAA
jgi:hypothetical protein